MPSNSKQIPAPSSIPLRRALTLAATFVALLAAFVLASVATAGNGGVGGDGGGGGGGGGGGDYTFPVVGNHSYGDGFGAGRNHQGQDVFAKCGKDLVAVADGKIQLRDKHSSAGNYVVLDVDGSKTDFAYMHLKRRALFGEGARVKKGERIGAVGDTGNASGCHLHFEMWSRPGYYEGGEPLRRVTRFLKSLD
jgi:murein DD-endopeptidase MepM/ murein hydrolase activator NlpD